MGKPWAKTYTLLNPNGKRVDITNLKQFCKENNLNYPKMNQAAHGQISYKDWHSLDYVPPKTHRGVVTDLSGQTFGLLTAQWPVGKGKDHKVAWLCSCVCGNLKISSAAALLYSQTTSCGCAHRERLRVAATKHGQAGGDKTPEYRAWTGLINRCENPNTPQFDDYGGRGIKVCERWRNSFEAFFQDMGEKPEPKSKYSLDRINVDGNYEPSNARWADRKMQNENQRRNNTLRAVARLEKASGMSREELIEFYESKKGDSL